MQTTSFKKYEKTTNCEEKTNKFLKMNHIFTNLLNCVYKLIVKTSLNISIARYHLILLILQFILNYCVSILAWCQFFELRFWRFCRRFYFSSSNWYIIIRHFRAVMKFTMKLPRIQVLQKGLEFSFYENVIEILE